MVQDYIKKTYAGWLGKVIGIRMGAPIEGWSKEKIAMIYGNEMKDYVVDYQDFAADDDSNGPIFFIRGLEHYEKLTPRDMGYVCLNYIPKEHGFFWWGGDLSTEHTAYKNLMEGIEAPASGSAAKNGMEMAEQIGGQIFIDGFGFVAPANPELACRLAEASARVTHDYDGVAGARFVAACIALAYEKTNVVDIVKEALSYISKEGNYYKVVNEMIAYYESGKSKEEAFQCLRDKYWTECYKGICHIIPNAGIMAIALLYGEGNYLNTMEIVNLLGFDTDCNAGNVGAIMGILCGTYEENKADGIPRHLITPIRDVMLASSVVGSLNISTLSENTLLFCKLGYQLAGEEMPEPFKGIWEALEKEGTRISHFEFTEAIHGFRIKGSYKNAELKVSQTREDSYVGDGCLKITINNLHPNNQVFVYQKTYYEPKDLHDARYQPCFSPIAYTGDLVSCYVKNVTGQKIMAYLYCYDVVSEEKYRFASVDISKNGETSEWLHLNGQIPYIHNGRIKEVGVEFLSMEEDDIYFGEQVLIYLDQFMIQGKPNCSLDFSSLTWDDYSLHSVVQKELSGFTHNVASTEGIEITDNGLLLSQGETIFTGDYYWRDYQCSVNYQLEAGNQLDMLVRSQGNLRSYVIRMTDQEVLVLCKEEGRETVLTKTSFSSEIGKEYTLMAQVKGNILEVTLKEELQGELETSKAKEVTLKIQDDCYEYGMVGFQVNEESVVLLKEMKVETLA